MSSAEPTSQGYQHYWQRFWDAPPRRYEHASAGERDRVDAIVRLLPDDVGTILDAGCGDGFVTNRLYELGFQVVGVDIEPHALGQLESPTRLGSVDALPASDGEFDCVIVADVLEHLPCGSFESALDELMRVAARYLVINSPNEEILVIAQTRCSHCSTAFHSSRHARSIAPADLRAWFPLFEGVTTVLCGERVRPRRVWLQRLGQLVADNWYQAPAAVCPNCGYVADPPRGRRGLRMMFAAAHRAIGAFERPRPTEFAVLLRRAA